MTDDGIPTLTMYKDNDGDGVAAKNAAKMDKCNVPMGWALPVDKTECPKCHHNEAYWVLRQTRAADEPETKIYRCTKCEHSWREY